MNKIRRMLAALAGICLSASMLTGLCSTVNAVQWTEQFDINGDGEFDIIDIIRMTKYLHNGSDEWDWDFRYDLADVDKDGEIDVFDLSRLSWELVTSDDTEEIVVDYTAKNLSADFEGETVAQIRPENLDKDMLLGQTKFALDLLRNTVEKEENAGTNVLVSPWSVSQALGMTANGAAGDTRSEMESVLGGSMETLNPSFYTFRTTAPDNKDAKLSIANSIWMREGFPVRDSFLQTNADFYGADAFRAPFDATTVKDVNDWVNQKTDKMIPNILNKIEDRDKMILVNAVAFDAKWADPYKEYEVSDGTFTAADGTKQDAKMMHKEMHSYLKDDHAIGFMNRYKSHYAFAALLPEEGMTPEEYLAGLTPERLQKTLSEPVQYSGGVNTRLPQFEYAFDDVINDQLQTMGMNHAFGHDADFSGITDDPDGLFIGSVLHKTYINVTPAGTRAAAVTAVMLAGEAMPVEPPINITLDRPFVYAIIDTNNNLPVFIGTVNSIKS